MHFNAGLRARGYACICERVYVLYVCMRVCISTHAYVSACMVLCAYLFVGVSACRVLCSRIRLCAYASIRMSSACMGVYVPGSNVHRVRKLACKPVSV